MRYIVPFSFLLIYGLLLAGCASGEGETTESDATETDADSPAVETPTTAEELLTGSWLFQDIEMEYVAGTDESTQTELKQKAMDFRENSVLAFQADSTFQFYRGEKKALALNGRWLYVTGKLTFTYPGGAELWEIISMTPEQLMIKTQKGKAFDQSVDAYTVTYARDE